MEETRETERTKRAGKKDQEKRSIKGEEILKKKTAEVSSFLLLVSGAGSRLHVAYVEWGPGDQSLLHPAPGE